MTYNLEELTLRELKALLQGLNSIQISGIDAMFIGSLQLKIQKKIGDIESYLKSNEDSPITETE